MSARLRELSGLLAALLVFVALNPFMQRRVFAFAEELMLHTSPSLAALASSQPERGPLLWLPSCDDTPPPRTLFSPERRPVLSLCVGGRRFPLMVASYISGYLYWPLALLAPVHHDDVQNLRAFGLACGVVDLLLTFLVVRRLRDEWLATAVVLATAVSPCFQVTHATLVQFETLPWTWLMLAVWVLLPPGQLAAPAAPSEPEARASRWRVPAAAFFAGLSVASNFKAVFLIAPVLAVAWRMGVSLRALRVRDFALAALAALVPLLPAIGFAWAHSELFLAGDRSADIGSSFRHNVLHPELLFDTGRDMLSFWAELGRYMDPRGTAPRSPIAYALALASLLFVVVQGARVLLRKQGCPVTAATAALVTAYACMLALLDRSYPVNFTPLHVVFGACVGLLAHALGSVLGARSLRGRRTLGVVLAAVLLALPFAAASVRTGEAFYDIPAPFNLHAEHELLAHLRAVTPRDHAMHVVSTENLLTGVVESMSGFRIRVAEAQDYLVGCRRGGGGRSRGGGRGGGRPGDDRRGAGGGRGDDRPAVARANGGEARDHRGDGPVGAHGSRDREASPPVLPVDCFATRFGRILDGLPARPLRLILPADLGVLRDGSRKGAASAMREGLSRAAAQRGVAVVAEAELRTATGVSAISVYRIDPASP